MLFAFFLPVFMASGADSNGPGKNSPVSGSRAKLTGQRVMQTFDFEERDVHLLPQPMHWKKVVGKEGFPHYSKGELSQSHPRTGNYSFEMIPDGGSVAFEYDHRRIPASPGSDFQVSGYVHFEQGENCRAQIHCVLTDRLGRVIPGSEVRSNLAGQAHQQEDGWAHLEAYVSGDFPEARYITIGLWVLQEEKWNDQQAYQADIFQKNVHAKAWFDDVTLYQIPRVVLRTNKPGNLFLESETVMLEVEVEGISSLDYQVELVVHDTEGKEIQNETWVLTGMEGEKTVRQVELEELSAGLYHSALKILSEGRQVATRRLTFAKLASSSRHTRRAGQDFGILLMDYEGGDWDTKIEMTRLTNAKSLKLPVWRRREEMGGAILSEENFDRYLIQLQKNQITVVATFSEVPDKLAMKMGGSRRSLLDVLSQDEQTWRPEVATILSQYARQVSHWQIGGDFQDKGIWDPRIGPVVQALRGEFQKLVSDTVLAVPVSSLYEVGYNQLQTRYAAMEIPSTIAPSQIPSYLREGQARGLEHIWVTVEPLEEKQFQREQVLIDIAKRIAFAKQGQAEGIYINHPWQERRFNTYIQTEPTEVYLVFRTLADYLGGARYVGEFELVEGMPALIFERDHEGCLFTWNNNYDPRIQDQQRKLSFYLGENPTIVDLFGNRKELKQTNGLAEMELTDWPVIITGVDVALAKLRASMELSPSMIDANIAKQSMRLRFENPFAGGISGTVRFMNDQQEYQNWSVDPGLIHFVLRPGQPFEQEIMIKLPSNELSGKKHLKAYVYFEGDRPYRLMTSIPFEIKLLGVDIALFTQRLNDGDLQIQQVVTNEQEQEITLTSFLDLPDQDHWEQAIPRLQPGATINKVYLIRDADQWLGRTIRIGLYDPKGTRRLNQHIVIN